jgi:hypothetical protein
MRPKTKGRVAVGLIVALLAFGLGTGTAIFSGYNQYSTNLTLINTTQPELPPIFTTTNLSNNSQNNQSNVQLNPSTNTEKVSVDNPSNQSSVTLPNQTNENQTP